MKNDTKSLRINAFFKILSLPVVFGIIFFLPAGTFDYWQGWTYMAVIGIPAIFVISYFIKHDPELMRRRLQFKEKEDVQSRLVKFGSIFYLFIYLVPGFDKRYIWSSVPDWLVIVSDVMVFFGYMVCFVVFRQNSYASRIVEVEEGQKVISTGLYSIVRHPMYVGVTIMFLFTPLALASYWAFFPATVIPVILIIRILNEEKVLRKDLIGYIDYCNKTKYRLIPYIW